MELPRSVIPFALFPLLLSLFIHSSMSAQGQSQRTIDIRIISPADGQQYPIGSELTVVGISKYDPMVKCMVYNGWNGLEPNQAAKPIGQAGENDYSTWTFTYNNTYHVIAPGTNILTARLSCLDDPVNMTKDSIIIVNGTASENQLTGQSVTSIPDQYTQNNYPNSSTNTPGDLKGVQTHNSDTSAEADKQCPRCNALKAMNNPEPSVAGRNSIPNNQDNSAVSSGKEAGSSSHKQAIKPAK